MKKNIFICMTNSMDLGGIESSLIGLLDAIDYEKYDVDLFLYGHHGPLFNFINKNVNILPEVKNLAYLRESLVTKIKNKAFYSAWRRIYDSLLKTEHNKSWERIVERYVPKFEKKYDIALGFAIPFHVLKNVNAKCKLGWIHTDYSQYPKSKQQQLYDLYANLDYIVAVSDSCADAFCNLIPEYANKVIIIENILSESMVKSRAKSYSVDNEMPSDGTIKLLTAGRFSYPKKMDEIPELCRLIRLAGLNVKWYLIGYGPDESLIRQKIYEEKMQDYVKIIGKKTNPYPYFKACDCYLQPSRFEGKSVAVREAQMLGKPVIITNYATAQSQLEDGVDGVIVPMEVPECAESIVKVLSNKELLEQLKNKCKQRDYSNCADVNIIYDLIESE